MDMDNIFNLNMNNMDDYNGRTVTLFVNDAIESDNIYKSDVENLNTVLTRDSVYKKEEN